MKCVPVQTFLLILLTSWWTWLEANCVQFWRSDRMFLKVSPYTFAHHIYIFFRILSCWNISTGYKKHHCLNIYQGGYNLTSLPQSVCQTVQTLIGDPTPLPAGLEGPCRRSVLSNILILREGIMIVVMLFSFCSALESLHCVRSAHKPYWSCLKHAGVICTFFALFF